MFLGIPASPTSASNWLTRLKWKEIFSSSSARSIVKKVRAVFKKYRFLWSYIMKAAGHISLFGVFSNPGVSPDSKFSASNWLTRFIWREIFSSCRRRSIVEKLRAVFEKYNIKASLVVSASDQISPYQLFPFLYVFMNTSLANQRPIGCLGSF